MTQEGVVLLDGATGSNLMKAGLPRGVSAEQWVTEHPDVLQELQRAYVEAGSKSSMPPPSRPTGSAWPILGWKARWSS